jgi:hypothetical protein
MMMLVLVMDGMGWDGMGIVCLFANQSNQIN